MRVEMMQKMISRLGFAFLFMLIITGCTGVTSKEVNRQERLSARVESYIKAVKTSDLAGLKSCMQNPEAARIGSVRIRDSRIENLEIDAGKTQATVKLRNDINAMGFQFDNVPQVLNWVWEKNDWFLLEPSTKNPFKKTEK